MILLNEFINNEQNSGKGDSTDIIRKYILLYMKIDKTFRTMAC